MAAPNTKVGNLKDLERRIRRLERGNPLSASSLGRGRMRFYDGSELLIQNGALNITGSATITGTLNASGVNNLSGTNNFSGINHLTGPTYVAGNFEIIAGGQFKAGDSLIYPDGSAKFGALGIASDGRMTAGLFELRPDGSANFGTLEILEDGTLNVNNDVNVLSDGQIKVGTNMTLSPTADGGSILFQDGSKVSSVAGTVQVKSSASGVGFTAGLNTASISAGPTGALMSVDDAGDWVIQGAQASMQSLGDSISLVGNLDVSKVLTVDNGADFTGRVRMFSLATASSAYTANVYIDANGRLWKTA